MRTLVIAEAGSCHDNKYEKAVGLIDVAKNAGADIVKFQFWSSAKRLAERRQAPDYLAVYEHYTMPVWWLPRLKAECDKRGLDFMCTCYLPEDIETVAPFVRYFKIASFEAGDRAFQEAHLPFGKPIIISLGMNGEAYVPAYRLHCVSGYPTPVEQANLSVIRGLGLNGFSDHTRHVMTGAFAVAAGAEMLEVHIRDWYTNPENPDFGTALDPYQFSEYVTNVRLVERMLGDGCKRVMPAEAAMTKYKVRA